MLELNCIFLSHQNDYYWKNIHLCSDVPMYMYVPFHKVSGLYLMDECRQIFLPDLLQARKDGY